MSYRYLKVNPRLSEYIRTVLVLDNAPETKKSKLPLFTNGTPALLCRTETTPAGTEKVLQLSLHGLSAPVSGWDVKKDQTLIAYFFKPFSLPCLFNVPAAELVKEPIEISIWNAHQAHSLKTQLSYSKTTKGKIQALDGLLLYQLQLQKTECEMIRHATDAIMLHSGKEILTEIMSNLNLNERTFQRTFKKFVGVTPTQYRRICQFKMSFDQVKNGRFEKLTDVAYKTGYADQSHFIRSFKEYIQTTPKDYARSGLKKK